MEAESVLAKCKTCSYILAVGLSILSEAFTV